MKQEIGHKVQKLLESRRNLKIELINVHKYIQEAIEHKKLRVVVENYIKNSNVFQENQKFQKDELGQMAEKVTKRNKICDKN